MPLPVRRGRSCPFSPAEEFHRLRVEEPVSRTTLPSGESAWVLARYADVRRVLSDPARFSNVAGGQGPMPPPRVDGEPVPPPQPGFFVAYDPPEHTRMRRMLSGAFATKRIDQLRPWVAAIVTEHLDAMERIEPPIDLMQAFAFPVPSLVICELLGVPYSDRADFQRRSDTFFNLARNEEEQAANLAEMNRYMKGLVTLHRTSPGDGVLGMLVREHGDELSDEELAGISNVLLSAGHETTSSMLGLSTLLLFQHPDQMTTLRENPGVVDNAVEELLRYLSVVHFGVVLTAMEDAAIGGKLIQAGDYVMTAFPSANRDTDLGDHLDRFEITRPCPSHVAFGYGIHHCLGASLARMELRIALPALLRRFPTLRLAVPFQNVLFRSHAAIHSLQTLPVTWGPA